jgi:GTPase SAR1 family protein
MAFVMPQAEEYRKLKIVLLGDKAVGKSSIIHRYINDTF